MYREALIDKKPTSYIYWTFLLVALVTGLGFLVYRFTTGLITTDMGSMVSWGLWISMYILFIGLSAGSFLLSTMIIVFNVSRFERIGRLALYSALICLMVAILFVLADLGHPERFWRVFTQLATSSVLWFEIMFYGIYIVVILAELYYLSRIDIIALRDRSSGFKMGFYRLLGLGSTRTDTESKQRDRKIVKVLGIIGIPTAIAVHGGTGAVFAVVKAIPHWHTPLLPIIFITSALVSGAALLLFLRAFYVRPEQGESSFLSNLAKLALGLLAIDWIMVIFEFLVVIYGAVPEAADALKDILAGDMWWIFWLIQVGVGLILPIILVVTARGSRVALGLAGLAIVIGIVAVRWNIIVPGLRIPKLAGFSEAFFSGRLTTNYMPTPVEWLSTIGLFALFLLLVSLGFKLLPLQAGSDHSTYEGDS